MADYDLKSITPSATVTDGTTIVFGAEGQAATPQPYTTAAIKAWVKSWADTRYRRVPRAPTGRWWRPAEVSPLVGSGAGQNTIVGFPFVAPDDMTITDLAVRITTADSGKNLQLALYTNNDSTMRPTSTALSSTANISTTTGSTELSATLGASVAITKGTVYWALFNTNSAAIATYSSVGSLSSMIGAMIGSATLADVWNGGQAGGIVGVSVASQTFGTWPDLTSATFTVLSNTSTVPAIALKA